MTKGSTGRSLLLVKGGQTNHRPCHSERLLILWKDYAMSALPSAGILIDSNIASRVLIDSAARI
jgi:hypothetical protein